MGLQLLTHTISIAQRDTENRTTARYFTLINYPDIVVMQFSGNRFITKRLIEKYETGRINPFTGASTDDVRVDHYWVYSLWHKNEITCISKSWDHILLEASQ